MAFKILSLDGGGTWALLQAMALADLYPGENGHAILSHFDLAVANSGGSIVLAGLMLDMPPAQIRSFFEDQTKRESIFSKRPFLEQLLVGLQIFPKYSAAAKRDGLGEVLGPAGDRSLCTWGTTPNWPAGPTGDAVRILIMAFDYDRQREEFLRSYEIPATGATGDHVALVDAVHASTNAPVKYFDAPALISPKRYWDGAMGGYNNPLMAGVVDTIALGIAPENVCALSLGTGTVRLLPPEQAHAATASWLINPRPKCDPVDDAGRAAACITDDPPDAATFTAHVVLQNRPNAVGRIVRASPVVRPVCGANGEWIEPPGLPRELFQPLSQLGMDAVEPSDVQLIIELGEAWLKGRVPNQPIRMRDDLTTAVGHDNYTDARAHWRALPV